MKEQEEQRDSLIRLEDCEEVGGVFNVQQVTKAIPIHVNLQWRIEKFGNLMSVIKPGDAIISKMMSFPPAPDVMWQVSIFPNGYRPENRNHLCCFLDQVTMDPDSKDHEEAHANCRIHLLAEDGSRLWLWENPVVSHEELAKAIWSDGSLVVHCEFKYLPPIGAIMTDEERLEFESPSPQKQSSMMTMENGESSRQPVPQAITDGGDGERSISVVANCGSNSASGKQEDSLKKVTTPSLTYVVDRESGSQEASGLVVKRVSVSLEFESPGNGNGPDLGSNDVNATREEGGVAEIADDKEVGAVARLLRRLALPSSVSAISAAAAAETKEDDGGGKLKKRGKKRCAIS